MPDMAASSGIYQSSTKIGSVVHPDFVNDGSGTENKSKIENLYTGDSQAVYSFEIY
jgi:hypothetical protein